MSQINGFKGFVGYGIRELSLNEINFYCSLNKSRKINKFPLISYKINFSSDFMVRSYSSGCYYYDLNTGKWNSDGMDIYEDTNLEQTHCMSNHLTLFAGGLVLIPSSINYQYVLVNSSFSKNTIIYTSVIFITCVYILFAIWSHYMDLKDMKKMNLVQLKDNNPYDSYFYELIVFTGNRSESGTHSKVKLEIIISMNIS